MILSMNNGLIYDYVLQQLSYNDWLYNDSGKYYMGYIWIIPGKHYDYRYTWDNNGCIFIMGNIGQYI